MKTAIHLIALIFVCVVAQMSQSSAAPAEEGKPKSGITGMVLNKFNNEVRAIQVLRNSPADKAGIKVGDLIRKINGKEISFLSLGDVLAATRGDVGGDLDLEVVTGTEKPRQVRLVLVATVQGVKAEVISRILDNKVGYIKITAFERNVPAEMEAALKSLTGKEMEGLIVDLRGNPGGEGQAVAQTGGFFVGRTNGLWRYRLMTRKTGSVTTGTRSQRWAGPMALLVDEKTGGVAALMAGSMQNIGRAVIVGRTTQPIPKMEGATRQPDGSFRKAITAEYMTVKGEPFRPQGIKPDVELETGSEEAALLAKAAEIALKK